MINSYLLVSFLISAIFSFWLYKRYYSNRNLKNIFWATGFLFMFLSFLTNFIADIYSWNNTLFEFYYFSSMVLVILLGLGTAYLFNKRWNYYFSVYSLIVVVVFAFLVFTASINDSLLFSGNLNAMPSYVSLFSLLLVIPGSVVLIIGAYYSAFKLRKNRSAVLYNSMIGTGALIFSTVGSLAMLNLYEIYYIGQLLGLVLMFMGFLKSINVI